MVRGLEGMCSMIETQVRVQHPTSAQHEYILDNKNESCHFEPESDDLVLYNKLTGGRINVNPTLLDDKTIEIFDEAIRKHSKDEKTGIKVAMSIFTTAVAPVFTILALIGGEVIGLFAIIPPTDNGA